MAPSRNRWAPHTHTTVDFMWECFSNKVYIVFLPAHTSHMLQPLDVAIFGPLKTAFKKYLGRQGGHDSSSVVAKKRFLYCYHKARIEALTESNIRSGWRATGLWPLSKHKALGSHFIEDNRIKEARSLELATGDGFSGHFCTDKCFCLPRGTSFATPKRSQELRGMVARYTRRKQSSPTQRLFFRKILKSWDQKDVDLTMSSQKAQELERQIEASRVVRRKKVQLDPNELFADIEAIRRTQIEAGVVPEDSDGSEESETPSETGSTIVVAAASASRRRRRG